jgi:hypothetical protein
MTYNVSVSDKYIEEEKKRPSDSDGVVVSDSASNPKKGQILQKSVRVQEKSTVPDRSPETKITQGGDPSSENIEGESASEKSVGHVLRKENSSSENDLVTPSTGNTILAPGSGSRALGVGDPSKLLDIVEREVSPQQIIREFTENSIQAIQAHCVRQNFAKTEGTVQWSMYPLSLEKFSVPKLACIDTGEGMDAEHLVKYIGNLASSGREHGLGANYGVGAKVSSMRQHPAGVVYETWQNGTGSRAILFRNEDGDAALRYFYDGEIIFINDEPLVQRIPDEEMPSLIRDNGGFGTMAILLGQDERSSNTVDVPEDYDGKKDDWVAWTLNHRYFSFPEGIEIRTAINYSKNPRKWNAVTGVEDFLERNHKEKGVIYLPGLEILWYTLKHHRVYSEEKSIFDSGAKMGFLYEEELYRYRTETKAQARMQHGLGIPFNANKIAIFFRPDKADIALGRDDIKINNLPIPEEDWFKAFKKNMPEAIKKMTVRQEGESLEKSTHFKGLMNFLKPQKAQQASDGGDKKGGDATSLKTPAVITTQEASSSIDGDASKIAGETRTTSAEVDSLPEGQDTDVASVGRKAVLSKGTTRKSRARMLPPEDLAPVCVWVKGKDAGMEGVAVRYLASENKLLLNEGFPIIQRLIKTWQDKKADDQKENVAAAVKKLVAVQGIDEIINLKRMEGQPGWEGEKVKKMLEDDHSLTLGLMNLYYLNKAIHNSIQHLPTRD